MPSKHESISYSVSFKYIEIRDSFNFCNLVTLRGRNTKAKGSITSRHISSWLFIVFWGTLTNFTPGYIANLEKKIFSLD